MIGKRIHRKIVWTAEDRARHQAIRERFQRERPTPDELVASGEYNEPVLNGTYFALRSLMAELKNAREQAGLSLADVAKHSDIDKAALSRLENGQNINPTIDTLWRYALALGKHIIWSVKDAPTTDAAKNGRPRKTTRNRTKKA